MATTQTTIESIVTPNWQLSPVGLGYVATDADDILLCIHNILFTIKGEVPFNPEFGSLIFEKIDIPINKIGAVVSSEVIGAITKWEKRVTVQSVKFSILTDQSIVWDIKMIAKSSNAPLGYTLNLNSAKENRRAFSDGFATGPFA